MPYGGAGTLPGDQDTPFTWQNDAAESGQAEGRPEADDAHMTHTDDRTNKKQEGPCGWADHGFEPHRGYSPTTMRAGRPKRGSPSMAAEPANTSAPMRVA